MHGAPQLAPAAPVLGQGRGLRLGTGLMLAIVIILTSGCESSRFVAAREQDTVQAYLRFSTDYPDSERSSWISSRVRLLRFRQARKVDRPLGYTMYLQQYPRSQYAQVCRERLAKLALAGARTPADYQLVVERYPGTPQAKQAVARVPRALATRALASADPMLSQLLLDQYPGCEQAGQVRAHLARLRYAKLADRRPALERFIQRFAGTAEAARARGRLRRLLVAEVAATRDARLLKQFKLRFPMAKESARLTALVQQHARTRALARVDLKALASLAPTSPAGTARLVRWCTARARRCQAIRLRARAAAPWQPAARVAELRSQAFSPDQAAAWLALVTLGWSTDAAAGDALLDLVGSARLSTALLAERALWRWQARGHGQSSRRWLARHRQAVFHQANSDAQQRRGVLSLLAANQAGRQRLLQLESRPGRKLTATYLLLRLERRRGRPLDPQLLARFTRASEGRLRTLREGFPDTLNGDTLVAATLAEHELFALRLALDAVSGGAGQAPSSLHASVKAQLASWRSAMARASETFQPARLPDLTARVARHQQGRAAALRALLRARDPLSPAVGRALCLRFPAAGCPPVKRLTVQPPLEE